MTTATLDARKRVIVPQFEPGQVVSILDNGNGTVTLVPLEPAWKDPFPPGSLIKEVEEWNKEFASMAAKMPVPPPPADWE